MTNIVCAQNHYNLAHRNDDSLIDELAKDGIAYVPFFPLGGFKPIQSSALEEVAKELEKTPMQVALASEHSFDSRNIVHGALARKFRGG